MVREQNVLGFVDPRSQNNGLAPMRLQPLHEAAMGLADVRRTRTRFKTKDLVGLLLAHGARNWRSSHPRAYLRLSVTAPSGEAAVKIRFQ